MDPDTATIVGGLAGTVIAAVVVAMRRYLMSLVVGVLKGRQPRSVKADESVSNPPARTP